MKKLTVVTLVVIMLAISVVPALAAGGPPENSGTANGNCTGDQLGLGTGNQYSYGALNQAGAGASNQYSYGAANQAGLGASNQYGYGAVNQVGLGASNQVGFGVRTPYALSGTISDIDPVEKTVTVTVSCGNRLANPFISQEVTLVTGDSTRFLLRNEDGTATQISFDDLGTGQNISSHGTLVNGVWTATRITSGALLTCLP